jgi:hypothetical protein
MTVSQDAGVNALVGELVKNIQAVLGANLTGIYLYGSLVWGDFDTDISDIDLLAATTTRIDENEFARLDSMHSHFGQSHSQWNERIEIAYWAEQDLRNFKTEPGQVALISPGEPFHRKEAGYDWLINLYLIQEKGLILAGRPARELIAPIARSEFIQAVKNQASEWDAWVIHALHSRPYQGYAILTLCRALYVIKNGEQVSKKKAAEWVMQLLPQCKEQVQKAMEWRQDYHNQDVCHEATYPETERFVKWIVNIIQNTR